MFLGSTCHQRVYVSCTYSLKLGKHLKERDRCSNSLSSTETLHFSFPFFVCKCIGFLSHRHYTLLSWHLPQLQLISNLSSLPSTRYVFIIFLNCVIFNYYLSPQLKRFVYKRDGHVAIWCFLELGKIV